MATLNLFVPGDLVVRGEARNVDGRAYLLAGEDPGAESTLPGSAANGQTIIWNGTQWVASSMVYEHTQSVASDTWTVNHDRNGKPIVEVEDSGGTRGSARVTYTNTNTLVIHLGGSMSGKAWLYF